MDEVMQAALAIVTGALDRTDTTALADCRTLGDAVRSAATPEPASLSGPAEAMVHLVASQIREAPETPLPEVRLVSEPEQARLMELAGQSTPVPSLTADELFARRARAHPGEIALVHRDREISYADLDALVDRLARHLAGLGVRPGVIVAVAAPRSVELIVALLGVLRAGGAYLPLDLAYPTERLAFMLDDASPPILLTTAPAAAHPAWYGRQLSIVHLDDVPATGAACATRAALGDPMYVIYTSGSTGRPKGVVVTHAGAASLAATQAAAAGAGPGDRVLQWASVSFDAAFWDLSLALFAGATLVLADGDDLIPGAPLAETLTEQRITHATLPPAAVTALPDVPLLVGGTLVSTGDVCTPAIVRRWAERTRVINGYGPTETTVGATITGPLRSGDAVSVGRPFVNTRIYLMDHRLRLVPPGVPGEICIGGPGVAPGYLNRPTLTAERFVPDPFGPPGARLYRSGDVGVWDDGGELRFLGRVDDQVKIRGFRIELGEIEAALQRHPGVDQAVAVARNEDPADRYVAAYVRPVPGALLDGGELRRHLRASLPEHMVPAAITTLDAFRVTANGKIDRNALPEPAIATSPNAPATDRERTLCTLFAEVLELPAVGVRDDFFACGGHSITAVRLIGRIRSELGVELTVQHVFEQPTAAGIAIVMDTLA